jgi:2-oxoglutarate dehydrogenase E1 component
MLDSACTQSMTVRGHHRARTEGATAVVTSQATNAQDNPLVGFGPNEWIVEDMYQRYLADPASVDPAWHDFFADYRPGADGSASASAPPLHPPLRVTPSRRAPRPRAAPLRPPRTPAPATSAPAARRPNRSGAGRDRPATEGRASGRPHHADPRRRRQDRFQHGRLAAAAHRDQRAGRAGQAHRRQPAS